MKNNATQSIDKLIESTKLILEFWKNSEGWAPSKATELLSQQKAEWCISLIENLYHFIEKPTKKCLSGHLILGYVCLRSLSEYFLKVFFCVYQEDYVKGCKTFKKNNLIKQPNDLTYEELKQLWNENIDKSFKNYLEQIQHRGNAIHSFNHKNLGPFNEFLINVTKLKDFFLAIEERLPPYPESER